MNKDALKTRLVAQENTRLKTPYRKHAIKDSMKDAIKDAMNNAIKEEIKDAIKRDESQN